MLSVSSVKAIHSFITVGGVAARKVRLHQGVKPLSAWAVGPVLGGDLKAESESRPGGQRKLTPPWKGGTGVLTVWEAQGQAGPPVPG